MNWSHALQRLLLVVSLLLPATGGRLRGGDAFSEEALALLARSSLASLAAAPPAPGSYLTPRVVPLRTRVITGDGSRATNYSVLLGTNQYVAEPLASGPGDAAGFHLLVLERSSLAVVTNFSAIGPDLGILVMAETLERMAGNEGLLVILYEMSPIGDDAFDVSLGVILSGFGANSNALYNPGNNQFASQYAFIGNVGLSTNKAFEVSSYVNPDADGRLDVVLTRDNLGNYFPTSPRFATVQASTGPNQDTVLIHSRSATNSLPAQALLPGAAGGFQLVVARRDILDQAPTNAVVVLTNLSFSTAAADPADSVTAMSGLASTLGGYQDELASGNALLLLVSIGSPILDCATAGCSSSQASTYLASMQQIQGLLQGAVGAVADLPQIPSGGYYALLGIPWASTHVAPASVEIRSWTPAGTNATALSVVLQSGPKGWFDPVAADATGGVDYRLYEIALRAPVAWPVASNAGSGPCESGDEACLAYQVISTNATEDTAIPSIRDTYLDATSTFDAYRQNLRSTPYNPAWAPSFSGETYGTVSNQISRELFLMGLVQKLHSRLSTLISDLATEQNAGLQGALSAVQAQVSPPNSATVSFSLDAELRFIAQLGAALDPDPVSKAALGVAAASLSFAMQKKTTSSGNGANRIDSEVSSLATAISSGMSANLIGLGELFRDIATDWSKLSEVGTLTEGPQSAGNGFAWEDGQIGTVLQNVVPAFSKQLYAALIPTTYQMVYFQDVPFSDPSAYYYEYDCVTWRTVICRCEYDVYAPPTNAFYQPSGSSDLYMLATPSKNYPGDALMQTGLPVNALTYLPDLFQGLGQWYGVIPQVLPQGWSDYLQNQGNACDNYLGSFLDSGNVLEMAIRTEPGQRYVVERSDGIGGGWTPSHGPVRAEEKLLVVRIPMDAGNASFFRFRRLD
ncbi:MAG: hypothetical protein J0L84_02335 [Verrucomicrobia bacterium]|nr:hypothetical protein [Verrucomicrobiota bacterium]